MQTLNLVIDGMGCAKCIQNVSRALEKLPGVTVEEVTVGAARVSFEPASASPEVIAQAITAAGYPARPAGDGQ